MTRRLIALFLFLLTGGCAAILPRGSTHVLVEELPFKHWRATYKLPVAQKSIVFDRSRAVFRAANWKVISPKNAKWIMARGHETVIFDKPIRLVVIEFFTDTTDREKDYKLNVAFSDGSRLLYTGHLIIQGPENAFTFHSPSRESIVVPTTQKDTYVYFGETYPVRSKRMRLIVDPGLPRWMAAELYERVPPMFDYFAETMDAELGFEPITYASYGGPGSGFTFVGGTLDRVVQIEVRGHAWFDQSDAAAQNWFGRAAHEVFHLWESQRFKKRDDGEWLGEASAEYARVMALRHFGVINDRGLQQAIVEAANQCIANIGDRNLSTAIPTGAFRIVYSCGLVSQWISGDAFAIDRRTFSRNESWGTSEYLQSLREMSKNADAVEQLVHGHTPEPETFLESELKKAGIAVTREGKTLKLE